MRKGDLENLALTGKVEGRRSKRKEKGALDVKFEGMAGGRRCERSGGRIAGESFKQGIMAGHDRQSQQIWHMGEREREEGGRGRETCRQFRF